MFYVNMCFNDTFCFSVGNFLIWRLYKWKLLVNGDGSDPQLFDMEQDKFEKNNIAGEHSELVAKLSKKVCEWYARNKDKGLQTDR